MKIRTPRPESPGNEKGTEHSVFLSASPGGEAMQSQVTGEKCLCGGRHKKAFYKTNLVNFQVYKGPNNSCNSL